MISVQHSLLGAMIAVSLVLIPLANAVPTDPATDGATVTAGVDLGTGSLPLPATLPHVAVEHDLPAMQVAFIPYPSLPAEQIQPASAVGVATSGDTVDAQVPFHFYSVEIPSLGPWTGSTLDTSWVFVDAGTHDETQETHDGILLVNDKLDNYVPASGGDIRSALVDDASQTVDATPHVYWHYNLHHVSLRVIESPLDQRMTSASSDIRTRADAPALPVAASKAPDTGPYHAVSDTPSSMTTHAPPRPASATLPPTRYHSAGLVTLLNPRSPAVIMVAAAGAATLLVGLGLYSLFTSKDVLKSDVRRQIFKMIQDNPGITIVALADGAAIRHQTVCYHLEFLKKSGLVTVQRKGNKALHFANGAGIDAANRELLAVSRDSTTMRVLIQIARNPGVIKKDVSDAIGLTRTAGAWHVNKLVKLGLITEQKAHGWCHLHPVADRVQTLLKLANVTPDGSVPPQEGVMTHLVVPSQLTIVTASVPPV